MLGIDLSGKVALIMGAAKGKIGTIGFGIAQAMANAGADILLNDLPVNSTLHDSVKEIKKFGVQCAALPYDMFVKTNYSKMVNFGLKQFGKIDILVTGPYPIHEKNSMLFLSDSEFKNQFLGTSYYHMMLAKYMAGYMMNTGIDGNIILISSVMSKLVRENSSGYDSGKAAINHYTKVLAKELAPHIRVNAILPGLTITDGEHRYTTKKEINKCGEELPLCRCIMPIEIGYTAAFLASSLARAITGSLYDVTSGQHLM